MNLPFKVTSLGEGRPNRFSYKQRQVTLLHVGICFLSALHKNSGCQREIMLLSILHPILAQSYILFFQVESFIRNVLCCMYSNVYDMDPESNVSTLVSNNNQSRYFVNKTQVYSGEVHNPAFKKSLSLLDPALNESTCAPQSTPLLNHSTSKTNKLLKLNLVICYISDVPSILFVQMKIQLLCMMPVPQL